MPPRLAHVLPPKPWPRQLKKRRWRAIQLKAELVFLNYILPSLLSSKRIAVSARVEYKNNTSTPQPSVESRAPGHVSGQSRALKDSENKHTHCYLKTRPSFILQNFPSLRLPAEANTARRENITLYKRLERSPAKRGCPDSK